jgi:hypothetical protein
VVPLRPAKPSLVLLLALAILPLPVHAQTATAPDLTPDVKTLYAHAKDDGVTMFMNTLVADGLDAVVGPEGPVQGFGAFANSDYTWTIPLDPALSRTTTLDGAGKIEVTAYMGAGTGAGQVSVSMKLMAGDVELASGDAQDLTVTSANYPTSHTYDKVTWSLTPAVTVLAPGTPLVWTVTATGTATNVYMGDTELRGRTNMVLPILSVGPKAGGAPILATDTNATFHHAWSFANATTQAYHYNWTHGPAAATFALGVKAQNGTVSVRVVDAANKTLVNALNATAPQNQTLAGAPGNWTVLVTFTAFRGNATLDIAAPATNTTTTSTTTTSTSSTHTTTTSATTSSTTKGTPSLGVALLVAGLGLAACLRRRD